MTREPTARFWAKVVKTESCWIWTGSHQVGGYGNFQPIKGRGIGAHRYAYQITVGPIPNGLQLDHLCRNRLCVNPAHLEPVTARENTLRGNTMPALNAAKTHCPNGHEYSHVWGGRRYCSTCQAAKTRRLRATWKAQEAAA